MRRVAAVFVAVVVSLSAHAATRTWLGAVSNLWSDPANWDTGVPAAGDIVRFDAPRPFMSPVNDLAPGLSLSTIAVVAGYNVSGNAITLTSLLTSQGGATTSLPITLGGAVQFTGTSGGTVNFAMPVNLNGNTLHIQQTFPGMTIILSNTISGSGSITTTGNIWFSGHNTFSGTADANSISAFTDDALGVADGTAANGTTAHTLGLNGAHIGNESITLAGQIICTGNCSLAGPVNGDGTLHVAGSGQFTISGRITSPTSIHSSGDGGGGTLTLTNPANSFANFSVGVKTRVGATGALDVNGLLTISGAMLDTLNNRVTVADFRMDTVSGTALAAGAQPIVDQAADRPPLLGGMLTLTPTFVPSAPAYTIIDNRGPYPINTQFDGLPEGGSFVFNGHTYFITYHGGDGNDVVLFVDSPGVPTTTVLTSSRNPSNEGDAVTFTATVTSSSGQPAGTVTFRDGATNLATVALNNGQATFTTSALSAGAHNITAIYNPSSQHAPSTSSTVVQTVVATPVQVSISSSMVIEGNSGTSPALFTVTLSHASGSPFVLDYTTEDGTATEGSDYLRATGTLTFAPGELHKTVVVEVIGDTVPENDETFVLRMSPGGATGVAIIRNDDVFTATTYEYAKVGNRSLTLDLTLPLGSGPFPVILWVHGADTTTNPALREVGRGYAVARVDYRTADEAKFPAQIADLKAAVRFLRANAATLHLDPLRIGAWSADTGAWFASLLGTAPESFDDPSEGYAGVSSRVSAVLEWAGETDLNALKSDASACPNDPNSSTSIESQYLGCAIPTCPSTATTASPVTWASSSDAAFSIVHGGADCNVPPGQASRLAAALQHAGADVQSLIVPAVTDPMHDPYWRSEQALINADAFFDAKLKDLEVPSIRRSSRH